MLPVSLTKRVSPFQCVYHSGPLVPFRYNASAPETLVIVIDGRRQRVALTADVPDAKALAALLSRSLHGVNVSIAIPAGSNPAYPHGAVGLASMSTGSTSFVSVDASSGPNAAALLGSAGNDCGVLGTAGTCDGPGRRFNGAGTAGADDAGNVTMEDIDGAVRRILTVMFRVGTMDAEPEAWNVSKVHDFVSSNASLATARKVATAAHVLLKKCASTTLLDASSCAHHSCAQ